MENSLPAYDGYYYAFHCGEAYEHNEAWLSVFNAIADRIIADIHPQTVLDAGCAKGFLVEALRARGVAAWGIDISEYAIQNAHPSIREFVRVGSVLDPLPQHYDLIVSIEVLEHLAAADAEKALANLCSFTDDFIFSSTPFDYGEVTHQNIHPVEYWAGQFARLGFYRDLDFNASVITPWAARFRRSQEPFHRQVTGYERRFFQLWQENLELRKQQGNLFEKLHKSHEEMTQLRQQNQLLEERWADLQRGEAWRAMSRLHTLRQRMFPAGSRRDHWLRKIFR